jgi:ankyrin repeat protein
LVLLVKFSVQSTPLTAAAAAGDYGKVRHILISKRNIYKDNTEANSALGLAMKLLGKRGTVESPYYKVIETLVEFRVNLNFVDSSGFTPLTKSVFMNNIPLTQLFLNSGANVNEKIGGESLLCSMVNLGRYDMIELLLKNGANQECRTNGETALFVALDSHKDLSLIELLVDYKANLECLSSHNETALMNVLRRTESDMPLFNYLIEAKADIDNLSGDSWLGSNPRYWTPLTWAATFNRVEFVSVLIQNGADVNIPNGSGKTALMMNENNDEIAHMLIYAGADINHTLSALTPRSYANSRISELEKKTKVFPTFAEFVRDIPHPDSPVDIVASTIESMSGVKGQLQRKQARLKSGKLC